MVPNNAHKDIPGNPSTAKSSAEKLNDRSNGKPLRVLSEEDWQFWVHNGYIVIKQAVCDLLDQEVGLRAAGGRRHRATYRISRRAARARSFLGVVQILG